MQRPDPWEQLKAGLWRPPLGKIENYVLMALEIMAEGPVPSNKLWKGLPQDSPQDSNGSHVITKATLRILEEDGLMETWKEGYFVYRRLTSRGERAAQAWLTVKALMKGAMASSAVS